MRIWFAAAIPKDSRGGVERCMQNLARGLRARGHETRVIPAGRRAPFNWYVVFMVTLLLRLIASGRRAPDYLVARSCDGLLCMLYGLLPGVRTRVVLHNHGWEEQAAALERRLPRSVLTSPTTWRARICRFPLLRTSLALCYRCMSGTVDQMRYLARCYPRARHRLTLVPNGVDVPRGPYRLPDVTRPAELLFVGAPTWKKNLEYAEAVMEKLHEECPEALLWVVGVPAGRRPVAAGDSIRHVSSVDPERMNEWYERCPYLLSTSRYEGGHSLAILEAMSWGMVVFASPIASIREFVRHGRNGFLLHGADPSRDALQIRQVIRDPERVRTTALRAARAAHRHRVERQVNRMERWL